MSEIYHSPVDWSVPFDNEGTGFVSKNVHDAIIEAKLTAEGLARMGINLTYNAVVPSTTWLAYNELLSNPRILFPVGMRIRELTFINANTGLSPFVFELYKNGQTSSELIYTYTPTSGELSAGYGYIVISSMITFAAGDSLYVRQNRLSGNKGLNDLAFTLWIQRTPQT